MKVSAIAFCSPIILVRNHKKQIICRAYGKNAVNFTILKQSDFQNSRKENTNWKTSQELVDRQTQRLMTFKLSWMKITVNRRENSEKFERQEHSGFHINFQNETSTTE